MLLEAAIPPLADDAAIEQRNKPAERFGPARIRPAIAADAAACGRIIYDAFRGISGAHGFPPDFPSVDAATELATKFIADPSIFGVVAEIDGRVAGSNFLTEGDAIRGVGPITVDPAVQGSGVGRSLMQAVIARGHGAKGVRLVQAAYNTRSMALYASLGFEVKEPLLHLQGAPRSRPGTGWNVRPMTDADVSAGAALCTAIHGIERTSDLREALQFFKPFVVEREGRVTGYLTAPSFWIMNHGVAETEADMRALIAGAATTTAEAVSLLLPSRQAGLLRWCLSEGMRVVQPMTLMSTGYYQEPKGSHFPSVLY